MRLLSPVVAGLLTVAVGGWDRQSVVTSALWGGGTMMVIEFVPGMARAAYDERER